MISLATLILLSTTAVICIPSDFQVISNESKTIKKGKVSVPTMGSVAALCRKKQESELVLSGWHALWHRDEWGCYAVFSPIVGMYTDFCKHVDAYIAEDIPESLKEVEDIKALLESEARVIQVTGDFNLTFIPGFWTSYQPAVDSYFERMCEFICNRTMQKEEVMVLQEEEEEGTVSTQEDVWGEKNCARPESSSFPCVLIHRDPSQLSNVTWFTGVSIWDGYEMCTELGGSSLDITSAPAICNKYPVSSFWVIPNYEESRCAGLGDGKPVPCSNVVQNIACTRRPSYKLSLTSGEHYFYKSEIERNFQI